jgi:predicted dehydrogenase
MLRTAIIGCGKIADSHAAQIGRVRDCRIVAACDREPLMARQLCDRFPVDRAYSDVEEMLRDARPDVVHITTPPQSHYALGKQCLEAGVHVYLEKPFTLYEYEARELIDLANRQGLKITAGHDDQFGHAARRMRALIQQGYLGSAPVHMESYYCYPMGRTGYAGAILNDKRHWVRSLPGKLLQNIISHGIARIAEFLTTDEPQVIAHGFSSPMLRAMGETEIIDELRVIVSEANAMTAYFTFSSQMRPALHEFRVFGTKNGLVLDHDQDTLIRLRGARYTSYAEKFIPPLTLAGQYVGNWMANMRTFLAKDFHMKSGMKHLIESFYASISTGAPLPIRYAEILQVARIMDMIFEQLGRQAGGAPEGKGVGAAVV